MIQKRIGGKEKNFFFTGINIFNIILQVISEATKELIILSPWLELEGHLEDHLKQIAVYNKVNITVLTRIPVKLNHADTIVKLQNMGAQIYFDQKLHAKLIFVDRKIAIISSINLLPRSLSENHEIGIVITEKSVISDIEEFLIDLELDILRAPILYRSDKMFSTKSEKLKNWVLDLSDKLRFSKEEQDLFLTDPDKFFQTCPECHNTLIKKTDTDFGDFWACSGYPDCNFTRNIKWKSKF